MHCNGVSDPNCLTYAATNITNHPPFDSWDAIVLETNRGTHDVQRMLVEARAVNMLLSDTRV